MSSSGFRITRELVLENVTMFPGTIVKINSSDTR
jgi:hypothetical protein